MTVITCGWRARAVPALSLALVLLSGCAYSPRPADDASAPNDSVAVGYGKLPRSQVTSAVSSVSPSLADRTRVGHFEELLIGRVPGVDVERLGNGFYRVRVRGALVGDGEPLYVIDGTPLPPAVSPEVVLAGLSPADIQRIDVLKGPSAAVYGSRGANGVILITRRR